MSVLEDLIAMRKYMKRYGFSPEIGEDKCPRCFLGASDSVNISSRSGIGYLMDHFIGLRIQAIDLDDWTQQDAIAFLDIAIACATHESL